MKTLLQLTAVLLVAGFYSCKKSEVKLTPLASLNLTNAVIAAPTVYLNGNTDSVTNNNFGEFTLLAGKSAVKVVAGAQSYYNQTLSTANGSYYSLFLAGASPAAVDAILIKESYQNYTDSLCGVRFINLSPDSQPVSVDIQGNANGSAVSSLAYKAYTGFLPYPAKLADAAYNFEVRDAASGNVIATYTLNTPYFHNVTLALTGSVNAGTAAILQVNEF